MFSGGRRAADGGVSTGSGFSPGPMHVPSSLGAPITQLATTSDVSERMRRPHAVPLRRSRRRAVWVGPAGVAAGTRWIARYQLGLVVIDLVSATLAARTAYLLRFGSASWASRPSELAVALLPFGWVCVVALNRGYEGRSVGAGATEFARVFKSFLHVAVAVAVASYALHADLARGFALSALVLALVLDLVGRYVARKWLHRRRRDGQAIHTVLAVGDSAAVVTFANALIRDRYAGMLVRGACLTSRTADDVAALATLGVPVLGDIDVVLESATSLGADTVAVVASSNIGSERLRWIAWQLEDTAIDLVVSPGLAEIAGRRLHICPVAGLPLLHVDQPEFRGFRRLLKDAMDRTAACFAILLLAPLFAALYVAVRISSPGPAIFRQVRVGRDGRTFTMIKFRSMYVDAEARLAELRSQNVHGEGPLFKIHGDPRVTRVGRILRRYSLDELPQFFNVLAGQMSLVGPRPPLPAEVSEYEDAARRRLLVKPGLTGLWQISGRSDLSWQESVRLDLRYVENWSPVLDLMILWKTASAVVRGSGAY